MIVKWSCGTSGLLLKLPVDMMTQLIPNLRVFLSRLRERRDLIEIEAPVNPQRELAEVHRRVIAAGGPALLFKKAIGSDFPIATNLFGTRDRVLLAFGHRPRALIEQAARLPHTLLPPKLRTLWQERSLLASLMRVGLKRVRRSPVIECRQAPVDLTRLPVITSWEKDGGPFLTLPLVYTEHPENGGHNLGIYRMQRFDATQTGMHWQIGKGGGFHYRVAEEKNQSLPVTVFLGGPPALLLSAVAPLPENVPELLLASLVLGERLPIVRRSESPHPILAEAEFALLGEVAPKLRRPEGPFGDHYGYYSLTHDYPVFHCRSVFHRKDAIYPATVVGKPRQEDFYIGDFLQELLSPLFPVVMPNVKDLWSYGETGYHSLAAVVVKERYKREALSTAFRILGEGQLSLTKFLLVLDRPQNLRSFPQVLEHVLERCQFEKDLYIFSHTAMDSLDYTGPEVNHGSKGVLIGMGEAIRSLPYQVAGEMPRGVSEALPFCRGVLVLQGPSYRLDPQFAKTLATWPSLQAWPLIVLVDDAKRAVRSSTNFLWMTFTRFDPASHISARELHSRDNRLMHSPPIVIDARMKPSYPEELFCDPVTAKKVTARWKEYFPNSHVEMGDSDRGHLE